MINLFLWLPATRPRGNENELLNDMRFVWEKQFSYPIYCYYSKTEFVSFCLFIFCPVLLIINDHCVIAKTIFFRPIDIFFLKNRSGVKYHEMWLMPSICTAGTSYIEYADYRFYLSFILSEKGFVCTKSVYLVTTYLYYYVFWFANLHQQLLQRLIPMIFTYPK